MSDSERRTSRPPDADRAPEDAAPGRAPLPEEHLPGEPAPPPTRLPGSTGPGREGLTADDRGPDETRTPPDRTPTGTGLPGEDRMPGEGAVPGEGRMPGERGMTGGGRVSGETAGRSGMARTRGGDMPEDGLGVPSSGELSGREARTTESAASDAWPTTGGRTQGASAGAPLLAHDETDLWEQRIRQLTAGFVDEPRETVERADHVLEEIAGRFEEAVERRRRTLRRSWEASEDRGPGSETDTEQLRLALRDYRELAGRLLHL
ncbi:hypothetical protein [Streptomyces sp. NPDC048191]|uniref:hypothetical protein n=1 Tax=Streptomyces sp. NPDC048191 TaxID=3155484 RepID=UPI0034098A74